jgi:serine protease
MRSTFIVVLYLWTSINVQAEEIFIPNDPMFDQQWGLKNTLGYDINAVNAWAIERGSKNVALVVIDSGIDYTHPDLINNIWINPNEIPNNGVDDDNNGYIDDIHGVNVITGSGDPMDDHGHGTFIAGVIGAEGNNGIGTVGVMHHVSLIACKFLAAEGGGSTEGAIKCLDYVADLKKRNIGVTIVATINGWGGGGPQDALKAAIERQRDLDILFMTTAGASATNLDDYPAEDKTYPASYDVDNIIVTAYMDPAGKLTSFASYGPITVDIASPGQDILSTLPQGAYESWNGSAAAGFASGVVGLMKSRYPHLTYQDLKKRLLDNATPLATREEQEKVKSGGFVNAYQCLLYTAPH